MEKLTNVKAVYFSPTGTTKRAVEGVAAAIAAKLGLPWTADDFTLPARRQTPLVYDASQLVVFGMPVYAGRVPNMMLKYLATLSGNGAMAIPMVCYGNRNYDDALIELRDILETSGMHTFAAAAFIGEHSFSKILAAGRPDEKDLAIAADFAAQAAAKLTAATEIPAPIEVTGQSPYRHYFLPLDKDGNKVDMRKIVSKVNDKCTNCGICADVCPMGSIPKEDVRTYTGICLRCGACIKACPVQARYYDNQAFIFHQENLEQVYARRAEPELFV